MTDNHLAAPSFDRMRNMLVRAAEVRESEQQQIFDALDDIYARLAPVDSVGAVRKRLSELPDRTEVGVLAERLDETMTRLEAQDKALAGLNTAVESIVDKLAKPFAQLDGRLDGMAAKFEGVAGRMDGLEDKLANIHRRLDELGGHLDKQDGKLDALPADVHGPVRERIDSLDSEVRSRIEDSTSATKERIEASTDAVRGAITDTGEKLDPAERLANLAGRVDELGSRLDKVEEGIAGRIGDLDGTVKSGLSKVDASLAKQPDTDEVGSLVRQSNEDSERRIGGQLDEAMATFAELMLGGGPAPQALPAATPAPRQPRRSTNGRTRKTADSKPKSSGSESSESSES